MQGKKRDTLPFTWIQLMEKMQMYEVLPYQRCFDGSEDGGWIHYSFILQLVITGSIDAPVPPPHESWRGIKTESNVNNKS